MKRLLLILILALASLVVPAAEARIRVVRHPAEPCSFSLLPAWGAAAIPAAGQTRGIVFIYGQTASCAQWNAYSSVDWVVVEAAPMDAQPAAYVTVAPNPATEARATTLIIAGIRLDVTQEGAPALVDPNLVTNGSFHTSIDGWIWYDGRFPNGRGTASWSPLDANGDPSSGSISMLDTSIFDDGVRRAFQRLQCLPVTRNTTYDFGTKIRTNAPVARGDATIALFMYKTPDCSGEFTKYSDQVISPSEPNVWEAFSFSTKTASQTESVVLVIASYARNPPFETLFDDVYVLSAE